ncbi:MAG: patatin-like phospholipase family protein [Syntrophomonas sp.]
MKKLGLALGGGGLKGLAHIGVLQILYDNHIPVNSVSGTSSGSIVAALMAAGISPYEMEEIVLGLKKKDYIDYDIRGIFRYVLSLVLPGVKGHLDGIIRGCKLEKLVYQLTRGQKLNDLNMPMAIIACNIDTGQEVIFTNRDIPIGDQELVVINNAFISEAVRASISIPATFIPKYFAGMQMVDGGVKDVVPVFVQKNLGAEYIMAVNLGQEVYKYTVTGIPRIISRSIDIMTYETSDTSQHIFADMIINPHLVNVDLGDMERAPEIIRAGRRVMKENIEDLVRELRLAK